MKFKINLKSVFGSFIFLYPLTPWYLNIGPLNYVNIVSICFIIMWISCYNKNFSPLMHTNVFFWIYLLVYSLQALFDTTLVKAFAYISAQLVVCIIVASEIKTKKLFQYTLDTLIAAGGILSILGIIEGITKVNIFQMISNGNAEFYNEIRLGILRIATSFSHPIVYCNYLCFLSAIIAYRLNNVISDKRRKILRLIYVAVIINAILTLSRSTLLILAIEQIIIAYKLGIVKLWKKVFSIGITLLLIVFVLNLCESSILNKLQNILYMFLSILNEKYSSLYSVDFGMNTNAVGNRLDLYNWVISTLKGHELFGMGTSAKFSYLVYGFESTLNYSYTWIKTSIENEYLYNYFIHGIFGLAVLVLSYVGNLYYLLKRNIFQKKSKIRKFDEKQLNFNFIALVVLVGYYVSLFSVSQSDTVRIYNIFVCLIFAYNYIQRTEFRKTL
ncbi:hypothetical protein CLPUN_30490 [Clostridium puniceum]|uniref:O-antigen ligase-related domain-containing protein n=1 Tax=Clostridium puniceum TaxID=29367 RepID=A0A1S8TEI6_9CLOT|nr:O-antigen ligase family protein [Clostridium puniceum]OOM75815.1 hypothetical protein CLPUN_30490 [Clostridium puniceum]